MAQEKFRFTLTEHYKVFTLFMNLPAEIRRKIWIMSIPSCGRMHVARIDDRIPPVLLNAELHQVINWREYSSTNGPEFPDVDELIYLEPETAPADFGELLFHSNPFAAVDTELHLKAMHRTCFEARKIAREIRNKPGNQLTSDGHLLTLQGSNDVVCLEYMDWFMYTSSRFMEAFRLPAILPNLRRVAFPYCEEWERSAQHWRLENGQAVPCPRTINTPFHLYQFMAKNLPALEDVYLIDYKIARGRERGPPSFMYPAEPDCKFISSDFAPENYKKCTNTYLIGEMEKPEHFSVGNLNFYQVIYGTNWDITTKVMEFRQWLRHRFVYFAKKSPQSRHLNPEKVRFHVLACEYTPRAPRPVRRIRDKLDAARLKRREEAFIRWDRRHHSQEVYLLACDRYQRRVEQYMRSWGFTIPPNTNQYDFTGVDDELARSLSRTLTLSDTFPGYE